VEGRAAMTDKKTAALYSTPEAARYLRMSASTLNSWLGPTRHPTVLVHSVADVRRGAPRIPFVGLVEAYVLRSLRDLKLSTRAIEEAAAAVRREFGTDYGLATKKIATDGIDIFIEFAESGDIARAHDGQRPIREIIQDYLRYIEWDEYDGVAARLRLPQFPESAPVVLDPDYAWGQPVLAENKTPLEAIVNLWKAGETMEVVAEEYGLDVDTVENLCRAAVS
jgi:uncharacterized protein (DUF433 family)